MCQKCLLFLSPPTLICPDCKNFQKHGKTHKYCQKKTHLEGLVSFYDYEGLSKKLINKTKQESLIDIPRELSEYGFLSIEESKDRFFYFLDFLYDNQTVLTYVPITKSSFHKRGFNQSQEAANHIGRFTRKKVETLLLKVKENRPQKGLKKNQREANVRKVFSISDKKIPPKVIIIDDVWTSGATLRECSRVLREAGVKRVWGLTLTRVP